MLSTLEVKRRKKLVFTADIIYLDHFSLPHTMITQSPSTLKRKDGVVCARAGELVWKRRPGEMCPSDSPSPHWHPLDW
ncbi:hypothetical protein C0Q70_02547 [Pomacea canaliculata]|uniref:Uncharacterized protein n=1 Tax=Pomacea canaliculata TaxID=400727 RepID=A0A2T7PQ86_POMCA|nr:hypothetical protein C0Q70_02547 [Pomacea canaliculata]